MRSIGLVSLPRLARLFLLRPTVDAARAEVTSPDTADEPTHSLRQDTGVLSCAVIYGHASDMQRCMDDEDAGAAVDEQWPLCRALASVFDGELARSLGGKQTNGSTPRHSAVSQPPSKHARKE